MSYRLYKRERGFKKWRVSQDTTSETGGPCVVNWYFFSEKSARKFIFKRKKLRFKEVDI